MKTNAELQEDVAGELQFDPGLDASRVAIAIRDGVVSLSGTVPSFWQKLEAERATKRVNGVRAVANDIKVELGIVHRRDDTDIARDAALVLHSHSDLPPAIQVSVDNGWASMSGVVDWNYQRQEAENAISHLSGVKGVTNLISIKPTPKVGEVRDEIRSELERTVDLDANKISIDAYAGNVTLTGSVRSWFEEDAARRAAWSVPGVTNVNDQLVISST